MLESFEERLAFTILSMQAGVETLIRGKGDGALRGGRRWVPLMGPHAR